jgi:SAM-dependent methyltransferase
MTAAAWDRMAPTYDRRLEDPVYAAGVRAAVGALAPPSALCRWGRVLDAGCGTGIPLRTYWSPGLDVTALDFSADSLAALRRHLPAARAVRGDLLRLPFPDGCFDRVLCANTLQHFPPDAQDAAVAELARVTKPDGRAAVSVHQWSVPKRRAGWKKEGVPGGRGAEAGYIYRFEPDEFHALLSRHFARVRVRGAGFDLPYGSWRTPPCRLAEWYGRRRQSWTAWGHMLVASCRR